jgi:hypothetical protein
MKLKRPCEGYKEKWTSMSGKGNKPSSPINLNKKLMKIVLQDNSHANEYASARFLAAILLREADEDPRLLLKLN